MVDVLGGLLEAFKLLATGDQTLYQILYNTLLFSGTAVILAALWGTGIAMLIALKDFRGKTIIKTFLNAMMGLPTVVLGLILFLVFSKGGPLGFLELIYTPGAIIIGQAILVTPLLASIATQAIEAVDPEIINLAKTLGASESQASIAVLREALDGVILANIASFNRAIAELGVVLLVGGSIMGSGNNTAVLTTAISFYTQRGELGYAIALGIILMVIIFGINLIIITARKAKILFNLGRSPQ